MTRERRTFVNDIRGGPGVRKGVAGAYTRATAVTVNNNKTPLMWYYQLLPRLAASQEHGKRKREREKLRGRPTIHPPLQRTYTLPAPFSLYFLSFSTF